MTSSSSASNEPAKPSPQLSPDLPSTTTYLTGHNDEGKAIVQSARPAAWKAFEGGISTFLL